MVHRRDEACRADLEAGGVDRRARGGGVVSGAAESGGPGVARVDPHAAIGALVARVAAVEAEEVSWEASAGRVLAEAVALDRPSPALDVSQMDGYAVGAGDLRAGELPVIGETPAGGPGAALRPGAAIRVLTGAPIPAGADAVIPRELVEEGADRIVIRGAPTLPESGYIRRRGENGASGRVVVEAGRRVTAPALGAIAACGRARVRVRRGLRVGVLVTGDEIVRVEDTPAAWQLRDGNGPGLLGLLGSIGWIEHVGVGYAPDDPSALRDRAGAMLDRSDALILSGGVSVGAHDHVPAVLEDLGVETVFHRLPIRPGRPMLGGVAPGGRPVLGLPGNPVSTLVTARVLGVRALAARAGIAGGSAGRPRVEVVGEARAPDGLVWLALARIGADGRARLVPSRGSGDWVSASGSDGVVEIPAGEPAAGWRPYDPWTIGESGAA
jgi:molybdopterin molybdotransferase